MEIPVGYARNIMYSVFDCDNMSLFFAGAKDGEMICCVCMGDSSEKPNEIVLCDNCGQGQSMKNCNFVN